MKNHYKKENLCQSIQIKKSYATTNPLETKDRRNFRIKRVRIHLPLILTKGYDILSFCISDKFGHPFCYLFKFFL